MPDHEILGALRHRCFTCGGGCHGTDVTVLEDERERMVELAAKLGIDDPLNGDQLRQTEGRRCVFLGDNNLCRLHSEFGFQSKPTVCRQYPMVGVQVGLAVRLVVDPGCMYAWKSWPAGPDVAEGTELIRSKGAQPMSWLTEERALIKLCDPTVRSLGEVLGTLADEEPVDGLAVGLALTLISKFEASGLARRMAHPENAVSIQTRLAHVVQALPTLGDQAWNLAPAEDAWAVEATRRFVFMRASPETRPIVRALAMLTGVVVCGLADPEPERFGPALAAWSRVMRTPAIHLLELGDVL